jgi:hypothetical protein
LLLEVVCWGLILRLYVPPELSRCSCVLVLVYWRLIYTTCVLEVVCWRLILHVRLIVRFIKDMIRITITGSYYDCTFHLSCRVVHAFSY